ncbi:hypothetical protein [Agrobacterium vitis]|uniref:Uncharacterized protein n=1 Tax=Agrobacterium vitis TaxID=373 RepID=A0AAE2RAV8_AGRVI|nr:hypothetical protein [Agrobacterium vitis]
MATFKGKILRSLGLHRRANEADAEGEERGLLAAEHRKPENSQPRKVTYHEIMEDLATGEPGSFLDRKIQSLMASDLWPPQSMTETFDKVRESGQDNAWTTSVTGVSKLIIVSGERSWQHSRPPQQDRKGDRARQGFRTATSPVPEVAS